MADAQAYHDLLRKVKRAYWRYNCVSFYTYFVQTLFFTLILTCLIVLSLKFTPWQVDNFLITFILTGLSLPMAFILFYIKTRGLDETAILVDKELHLKEKISSALEISDLSAIPVEEREWREILLHDALRSASRLDLRRAFPWKNPWAAQWLWAPLFILFLTVVALPQWDLITGQGKAEAKAEEKKAIERQIEKMKIRQLTLEKRAQEKKMETAAKLAEEIKELANDLSKGKIEKRDALAKMSSLEQEWEKRKEELEKLQPQMKEMSMPKMKQKMTGDLASNLQKGDYKKAAEEMQKLQKKMKMGDFSPEDMERLSSELKNLAENLDPESPLAKALKNAAKNMKMGEKGDKKNNKSNPLDPSDMQDALKSLELAEMGLMDMEDMLNQMNTLDAALCDLKDSKYALAGKFGEGKIASLPGGNEGEGEGQGSGMGPEGTRPWKAGYQPTAGQWYGRPRPRAGRECAFRADQCRVRKIESQWETRKRENSWYSFSRWSSIERRIDYRIK